jgi:hypothetical protein
MWQVIALSYLGVGLALTLFTRARGVIDKSMADVTTADYPLWKVATYRTILNTGSILLWPLFLGSWFSRPKSVWDALNENPEFQEQKALFEAMRILSEDGADADELPNGKGEFGTSASNPIPCNSVFGSTSYLAHLRTADGIEIEYERIGSVISDVSPHPVDEYQISLPGGQPLTRLFISPYQKRTSQRAPVGLRLINNAV